MKNTIKFDDANNSIQNQIDIKKLLIELENIGSEKEKEEFIKNYSRIKEEIKITDNILNDNSIVNTNEYESKTINELFQLLEQDENKIFDDDKLTITELKSLIDICNVLDKKINDDTISIIEN